MSKSRPLKVLNFSLGTFFELMPNLYSANWPVVLKHFTQLGNISQPTRLLLLYNLVINNLQYPASFLNDISGNFLTTLAKQLIWVLKVCFNKTKIDSSTELKVKTWNTKIEWIVNWNTNTIGSKILRNKIFSILALVFQLFQIVALDLLAYSFSEAFFAFFPNRSKISDFRLLIVTDRILTTLIVFDCFCFFVQKTDHTLKGPFLTDFL